MNKLFSFFMLCSVAAIAVHVHGVENKRPDVVLVTGEKITAASFDRYLPAVEQLCQKDPKNPLCLKLLALAKLANVAMSDADREANLSDADRVALFRVGLTGTLKPEIAALLKASLVEDPKTGLSYRYPAKTTVPFNWK
jgi:hypothetical protein